MKKKEHKTAITDIPANDAGKKVHECKNCSTEIEGPYCNFCGQRYHDHKESFGELVYEFIADFLHFDSRFFKTVIPLLFAPGKLTKSYNEGKQRSQFHPIRLYLFSSFIYFFLFFTFTNVVPELSPESEITSRVPPVRVDSMLTNITETKPDDTILQKALNTANIGLTNKQEFVTIKDSNSNYSFTVTPFVDSLIRKKVTPSQYKEIQKKLPKAKRAGLFERMITMRVLEISQQGEYGKREFFRKATETFFHNLPKALFFLLPVFAFILKLLYIRHRQFYFVDHAILSLHYFSFIFLILSINIYLLDKIFNTGIFGIMASLWIMIYLLIMMKRLYLQSWGKTLIKYFLLGFLFFFVVLFTLFMNMAVTAFMV